MTKFKPRKSKWKPEDYTDSNIKLKLVNRSCEECVHESKDLKGERSNICVKCLSVGGKKQFKKKGNR
jgi:hypothetical protein